MRKRSGQGGCLPRNGSRLDVGRRARDVCDCRDVIPVDAMPESERKRRPEQGGATRL